MLVRLNTQRIIFMYQIYDIMVILDFYKEYPDEHSCRLKFKAVRGKEGVTCKKCGCTEHYWKGDKWSYECKKCRFRTSLRSGTVMQSSKLPFQYWFIAMHLLTALKKSFSAKEVQRQLKHKRYEPIWAMMHKIRSVMGLRDDTYLLTEAIELDEGFFETVDPDRDKDEPKKRGRGSQRQTTVLVMVESRHNPDNRNRHRPDKKVKYLKMKVIENLSSETINQGIETGVEAAPPEELVSIKKSADKLNRLIHQLLEFRKIETDHAKLELSKGDIILFLQDTFQAFEPLFEVKNIVHDFRSEFSEYSCYFDPSKVEMIATNLISNALKNTPHGGHIKLQISISNSLDDLKRSRIFLKFSDTGMGMSPEVIQKVTEPFYKSKNEGMTENSGLGLALVKSLVEFLNGKLKIDSEIGKGTQVSIAFPLILKTKNEESLNIINGNKNLNISKELLLRNFDGPELYTPEKKSGLKILIAEDNLELMRFLQKHFSTKFHVITAKDGEHAMEKMKHSFPDIIISDVKMPNLSGIQLCKKIKTNSETKHIPFLLLTAKNDEILKLDALSSGANAYLAKPFNLKELDLLVTNLLETSKNLEKRFSEIQANNLEPLPVNNQDREFLRKISALVEEHHPDPKFGVETLANKAGISRSLLHVKMKKIIGLSALEYIKRVRMKKATRLIREGKNISEVAYNVGYSDPNYFSRAFKKEFKLTPTQFAGKY